MRIVHVPFSYAPDPPGGTELYVAALAGVQQERGTEVMIMAPAAAPASYTHQGISVRRYAVSPDLTRAELWGAGDPLAARGFAEVLDSFQPDVVHFHAYTSGVSLLCAREVASRSIDSVFTYHTPSASCARGTLMRWGRVRCDGLLLDHRCGACIISKHVGTPVPLARLAERPVRLLGKLLPLPGKLGTGLKLPELVSLRNRCNMEFLRMQRRIIVQSSWSREVLLRNDVPAAQMTLVRHGLLQPVAMHALPTAGSTLRVGFFGRLDPDKGLHLLLQAVASQPDLPIRVSAYVVDQPGSDAYGALIRDLAAKDQRITVNEHVPHAQLAAHIAELDLVAVPSVGYETGPMIALEAFAVGVPVIGSRVGGVDETVIDGENGVLVDPTVESWSAALAQLTGDPEAVGRLRPRNGTMRTIEDVASEVDAVYMQAA